MPILNGDEVSSKDQPTDTIENKVTSKFFNSN